jgi:hypothetical protein
MALDGELSTLERYQIGAEMAAYIMQDQRNPKLAFVGQPPEVHSMGKELADGCCLIGRSVSRARLQFFETAAVNVKAHMPK